MQPVRRERIKADIEILKGRNWKWVYLDKRFESTGSGYMSYRNIVVRALFKILQKGHSKEECKRIFYDFKDAYNKKMSYESEEFLQLFHYYSNNKLVGALIEDQTEGSILLCLCLTTKADI